MSHYVTNIGSATFIGVAGTAAVSGYAVIAYEFHVSDHFYYENKSRHKEFRVTTGISCYKKFTVMRNILLNTLTFY